MANGLATPLCSLFVSHPSFSKKESTLVGGMENLREIALRGLGLRKVAKSTYIFLLNSPSRDLRILLCASALYALRVVRLAGLFTKLYDRYI